MYNERGFWIVRRCMFFIFPCEYIEYVIERHPLCIHIIFFSKNKIEEMAIFHRLCKMTYSITYVGAKWCKTCVTIKPKIEELCKKFQISLDIKDLEEDCTEAEQNDIAKVPTIYVSKNDQHIAKYDVNQVNSVESLLKETVVLVNDADF